MPFKLDHLFVCCSTDASEADVLLDSGFKEGQSNTHPGQGTSCRRFFFRNAYLEFLWVHDELEARSDLITPTALWERSQYRQTGYCPFGIGLRHSLEDANPEVPPFTTWSYRPPYLPAPLEITIADSGRHIAEPLIFIMQGGGRPDEYQPERRQPLVHACGAESVTCIEITVVNSRKSKALTAFEQTGIVLFRVGMEPLAEVELDGGRSGALLDCRPVMPLVLRW